MEQTQQTHVSTQRERAQVTRPRGSTNHPGSKKGYRHITVTPGRGRNAWRAASSIRRSAPKLYLPSRSKPRPRYQRPSNG